MSEDAQMTTPQQTPTPEQTPTPQFHDYGRSWPEANRSRLCVGIDPHAGLLADWSLPDSAAGARDFGLRVVEAAAGECGIVKPQAAFFERHGSRGLGALEDILAAAHAAGLSTILDIKRGDIGSTMAGYAEAYMNPASPLYAHAVTLSPYLGFGSLEPAFDCARRYGSGAFVLALTSNPDGARVQHARTTGGQAVAAEVIAGVQQVNAQLGAPRLGVVVGATTGSAARDIGIDLAAGDFPILAPGYGAQGAGVSELHEVFGPAFADRRVIVNAGRTILSAGPDIPALRERIRETTRALSG